MSFCKQTEDFGKEDPRVIKAKALLFWFQYGWDVRINEVF